MVSRRLRTVVGLLVVAVLSGPAVHACLEYTLEVTQPFNPICWDGSTCAVTASVWYGGSPVMGVGITFSVNGSGSLDTMSGTTNYSGNVNAIFTSDEPGATTITATMTSPVQLSDYCTVHVVKPDVDVDSDNDGYIDGDDDSVEEDSPGKLVALNHDDDDDSETPDLDPDRGPADK